MAEMLTDLLQNIYKRIAQLGNAIQGLKESLDGLNKNIEERISNLSKQFGDLKFQIEEGGTSHLTTLENIGKNVTTEIEKLQSNLAIDSIEKLIKNLDAFSSIAEQTLKQENVDLLIKEALDSINKFKEGLM
jgi:DNA anti-recombination protein RmuC